MLHKLKSRFQTKSILLFFAFTASLSAHALLFSWLPDNSNIFKASLEQRMHVSVHWETAKELSISVSEKSASENIVPKSPDPLHEPRLKTETHDTKPHITTQKHLSSSSVQVAKVVQHSKLQNHAAIQNTTEAAVESIKKTSESANLEQVSEPLKEALATFDEPKVRVPTVSETINPSSPENDAKLESKNTTQLIRYQIGTEANPLPDYPSIAVKRGWQGQVVLGVLVKPDGSIEHLSFVKSTDYGVLNYEAYETVRNSWQFKPLEGQNNLTQSTYIEVPITFQIANR